MNFKRYKHNLSHYVPFTGDMGKIIPIANVEVIPGDHFRHQTSVFLRMSPLLAPLMHQFDVRVHHWYVPYRLVFPDWDDFITGGADGNDTTTLPTVSHTATPANEPLLDYLGVPPKASLSGINALSVRAYNDIVNHFYLDQDLATQRSTDDMTLASCAWEKDYFTAARPWTQKGTAVTIPITDATVQLDSTSSASPLMKNASTKALLAGQVFQSEVGTANWETTAGTNAQIDPNGTMKAVFASGIDMDALRLALATQNFKELRARYGSNIVDYLSYLGITGLDQRLQRPEYLGGGKQTISISEVLATGSEGATTNLGDMAGHGVAALRSNAYRKFFPEFGQVISVLSVRPKAIYANGLPRKFSRTTKEDYYQRELELIGQQEIYNKEVYIDHTTPDGVHGYGDRFGEYRFEPSRVAGKFRPGEALDHWTAVRSFSADTALNETFITCTPQKSRWQADATDDSIYVLANNKIAARRLVRKNPQPSIL